MAFGPYSPATAVEDDDYVEAVIDGETRRVPLSIFGTSDVFETTGVNSQTGTSYTLALTDRGQTVTMNNASANTLTVPLSSAVDFDIGSVVAVIQIGSGTTSITAASGVTLNGSAAGSGDIQTQYQGVALLKVGTDEWIASGDIGTVS